MPNRRLFVGRQRELALLRKGLEGVTHRVPMIVSIVGEAGIGKTALVSKMLDEATELRTSGFRVARAGAIENGGSPAYWLWSEVLRQLGLTGHVDFNSLKVPEADPLTRSGLEFRLFEDVTECIRRSAPEHPLLIIFEDLHWADDESFRLLSHFVRGLEGTGIGLIVTYRDQPGDQSEAADSAFLQIARTAGSGTIWLSPFSEQETAEALQSILGDASGGQSSGPSPGEVLERTGGNPMFVTEIARSAASGPVHGLPASVQLAVNDRLGALNSSTVEVLEIASLARGPFTPALLNRLAESLTLEQVNDAFDQAGGHQFLVEIPGSGGEWDFRHSILREVVASRTTGNRRVQLHLSYTGVLETEYRNALAEHSEEILFHAGRARPLIDDARLVRYLIFAARAAMKSLAFERAASHYTRVIELAQTEVVDDSLAEAMRGIVVAASGSGRDEEIAGYFGRAFRYYVSAGLIDLALEVAQIRFIDTAGMSEAVGVYEAALELVEPDSRIEANILGRLGRSVGMIEGDYSRAKSMLDRGIGIARRLGDTELQMQLNGDGVHIAFFTGERTAAWDYCKRVEELSKETSDPLSEGSAYLHLGVISFALGESDSAVKYHQLSLQRSIDSHVSERISSSHKILASTYMRLCEWELASQHIRSALEYYPSDERVLALKVSVRAMTGDANGFNESLGEFLKTPQSKRDSGEGATTRYLQMACRVEQDDGLLSEIKRSIAAIESRSHTTRMLSSALTLGRACLALEGHADDYVAIRERLLVEGLPDLDRAYLPGITSLAGLVDEAEIEFERMIPGAAESGQLFNEVWLRYDYAAHLVRHAGGETLIAWSIAQGRRVAEQAGIVALQAKFDRLESVAADRKSRTAGLTKRELEILRLLHSGKSNPEIAEQLVVSRHTVVRHISNIFVKLEVSNRTEAGKAAAELGLA